MPICRYGQRLCKYRIPMVFCALICMDLRDRVVDERLIRLTYRMDQGPRIDDTRWIKPKIKVKILRTSLEIGKNL